jgi:hypothetical protein
VCPAAHGPLTRPVLIPASRRSASRKRHDPGLLAGLVTRVLCIVADEGLVRVVPRWGTFRAESN